MARADSWSDTQSQPYAHLAKFPALSWQSSLLGIHSGDSDCRVYCDDPEQDQGPEHETRTRTLNPDLSLSLSLDVFSKTEPESDITLTATGNATPHQRIAHCVVPKREQHLLIREGI